MKKIILIMILSIVCSNKVFAEVNSIEVQEKLATIGFGKLFAVEPKEQIAKVLKNFEKYSNKHNIKKIKTFYDDKYVNADGFDYKTYFKLVESAWESYPDIEYENEIKNIVLNGDFAIVQVSEKVKGNAKDESEYLGDKGLLESTAEVLYYMKKSGNTWVITSDESIVEKTFLRYGEAKNVSFDIIAPSTVVAGEEYPILFATDLSKSNIVLGSITNEKITFPAERQKEVFRKLKDDGVLERFVRANKDGYNEQAVVSVGITKAEISDTMDMKLSVSGVAFLMSRVNVVTPKKFDVSGIANGKASEI